MAESFVAGPLDGTRLIDLSTVVTGPYTDRIPGALGADGIEIDSPSETARVSLYRVAPGKTAPDTAVGRTPSSKACGGPGGYRHITESIGQSMAQTDLGETSRDPEDQERVIQTLEKAYTSTPYTELGVMAALENTPHNKDQKEN
ncbi:hypothetical protein BX257_0058 [Streptomyces sp. 3212.3]|uniref:hypothetical protein n=1 Tax=Streptomyces sp. 3212.3 TaxID=1938846 RepID=UPI000E26D45F|nr:hypothetical protein [Streptomyces sp. 3212.3]REE57694.1 hypothetical protein BX257_0058 [Streptomyces sp. 3212.3]